MAGLCAASIHAACLTRLLAFEGVDVTASSRRLAQEIGIMPILGSAEDLAATCAVQ